MKLWLDDERPAPEGWHKCETPGEATSLLDFARGPGQEPVTEVSLDHDLGLARLTGYDVLVWIEHEVYHNNYRPPKMLVHSANSIGAQRMHAAITQIWALRDELDRVLVRPPEPPEIRMGTGVVARVIGPGDRREP